MSRINAPTANTNVMYRPVGGSGPWQGAPPARTGPRQQQPYQGPTITTNPKSNGPGPITTGPAIGPPTQAPKSGALYSSISGGPATNPAGFQMASGAGAAARSGYGYGAAQMNAMPPALQQRMQQASSGRKTPGAPPASAGGAGVYAKPTGSAAAPATASSPASVPQPSPPSMPGAQPSGPQQIQTFSAQAPAPQYTPTPGIMSSPATLPPPSTTPNVAAGAQGPVGQQVSGTGIFSGVGSQPTIDATQVYNQQQQQQLINQAAAQNARVAGGANKQAAVNLGGNGFAPQAGGALTAAENQNAANEMIANTQAMTNIPIQTGAANAQQLLAGQAQQQNQYNQALQALLTNQGQQYGFAGGLLNSILG